MTLLLRFSISSSLQLNFGGYTASNQIEFLVLQNFKVIPSYGTPVKIQGDSLASGAPSTPEEETRRLLLELNATWYH
jgi:hypothetical protein